MGLGGGLGNHGAESPAELDEPTGSWVATYRLVPAEVGVQRPGQAEVAVNADRAWHGPGRVPLGDREQLGPPISDSLPGCGWGSASG